MRTGKSSKWLILERREGPVAWPALVKCGLCIRECCSAPGQAVHEPAKKSSERADLDKQPFSN